MDDSLFIRASPRDAAFRKKMRNGDWKLKDTRYIIADNVKYYRRREHITQMELAEQADLSLDSIKRIEGGKRTMSLENFMRVAEALHVPLSFLVYEQGSLMPETERICCILDGRSQSQREYLLHMLQEMSEGMDKLIA